MHQPGRSLGLPPARPNGQRLHRSELETPALVVDLDMLEHNIATMASLSHQHGIQLRPHVKTHKTPAIAHRQMAAGACGICCANLGEAEVMVAAGLPDVLITRPVVGPSKLLRLCGLTRHTRLQVVTDSARNVADLAAAAAAVGTVLDVLIEVNVGQNRCGVAADSDEAVDLARLIMSQPSLRFTGLQGYEGHLVLNADAEQRLAGTRNANAAGVATRRKLEQAGIPVPVLTGGGTGTYAITGAAHASGYTELQPGSYATMDARYSAQMGSDLFRPALGLLATCISRTGRDRAILDAGSKVLSFEYGGAPIKGRPGLKYQAGKGGDEHGLVFCADDELQVGERVELYPTHGCTTFNLHNWLYGLRGDYVEVVWNIAARGCSW